MAWHATDPVNERLRFIAAEQSGLYTMTELCARYGVTRKTGYKWLLRYRAEGVDGLKERSHAPRCCPHRMSAEVERALLEARDKHEDYGPRKLIPWLKKRRPELQLPAASTVGDLLMREGRVEQRRRRRRTEHPGRPSLKTSQPNDVWTVDFKGQFRMGDRRYCYPLTIADAHTRYLLRCEGLHSVAIADTLACFERCFREYGLPRVIHSDNGSPFASPALGGLSRLNVWWLKLGIAHQRIEPGKPQQNAAHERMHRTLKARTTRPPEGNLEAQQDRFDTFRQEYNEERPHEALEQNPPASAYTPSERQMPESLPEPNYPGHFETRRVRHTGEFRFHSRPAFLSEVLEGELIGLEEIDDWIWSIYFYDRLLARYDERVGKVIP